MEALKYGKKEDQGKFDFEESFITSHKGYSLHKVTWMPKGRPKAILLIVHDIGDHILRYKNFANYFNEQEIGVVGIDLRGHGKSDGLRGSAKYSDYLEDVVDFLKYAQKQYPHCPRVVYGCGLGANLSMFCSIKQKAHIQGLIASSPWFRSYYNLTSFKKISSNILTKIIPVWTVRNKLNVKNLSHDLAIFKSYEDDTLVHHRISPGLISEANEIGDNLLRYKHKCNVPLLLMHGTSDKVTSWRASAEFSNYTSENTTLKLWENHYHELHNEFDKGKIYDYILQWINRISAVKRVIYGNF